MKQQPSSNCCTMIGVSGVDDDDGHDKSFNDAFNVFCVFKLGFQCLAPCIIPEIEFGEVIPLLSSLNIFTKRISKKLHLLQQT